MQSYVYNGKDKIYPKLTNSKKSKDTPLFKNLGFVLCGSYPLNGVKSNGSKLLAEHNSSTILDYQLDLIKSVCTDPEIIVTCGASIKDFIKHDRRNEFILVENQMYEFSNSAEDLRLGLMALRSPHVIFIESGFIPTVSTLKYMLGHKDRTTKVFIKDEKDENYVGVIIGNNGLVTNYTFSADNMLTGMYYINTNDIGRIRKRTISKNFSKNLFAFELMQDLRVKTILDESKSVLVTR